MVIGRGYTAPWLVDRDLAARDLAARNVVARSSPGDTTDSIGSIPSEALRVVCNCTISRSLYVHRKSVTRRFPWDFLAIISLQRRFQTQALARRFPARLARPSTTRRTAPLNRI
jgi:hypothetical protein